MEVVLCIRHNCVGSSKTLCKFMVRKLPTLKVSKLDECNSFCLQSIVDTFMLYRRINSTTRLPVSLSGKNIAWKSDVNDKFKNPSGNIQAAFAPFAKPPFWRKSIVDMTDHFKNEAFIVWMRVAAFPTFRKLHKTTDSLETGSYELDIQYSILSFE